MIIYMPQTLLLLEDKGMEIPELEVRNTKDESFYFVLIDS